jgi:glycerol-1-phosphate dehydrogenase [NAD(P)+]
MEFPQVIVFDGNDGEEDAGKELAHQMQALGVNAPFVVASSHGKRLASYLNGIHHAPTVGANQEWAADLGSRAHRSGADALVAVGGGRCLDVAKLAAARAGLGIIAVPTQLSHDGICSPVAVVPNDDGRAESVGAIAPRAVYLSLPTLVDAPEASARAGIGDLMANPLALRDWTLAIERGIDGPNERAWRLSVESFELIEPYLDTNPDTWIRDPTFLKRLGDALILSGLAMICAGTSRPASGGEHEISHALDEAFPGRALHGAQVAFGCIVSVALHGDETLGFRKRLSNLGLPQHPHDLGLSLDDVVRLLLAAPNTRPGRYTVLEAADLDRDSARSLVESIWNDA